MPSPILTVKALGGSNATSTDIVSDASYALARPDLVTGTPSIAMIAPVQNCTVRTYLDGVFNTSLTISAAVTPILAASGAMLTAAQIASLTFAVSGLQYAEVLRVTDEPSGSPSNPFASTAARNAAYATSVPSPHARVWAGGVEYEWIGTLTANTDADWVVVSVAIDQSALLSPTLYDIENSYYPREEEIPLYVEGIVPETAASADILTSVKLNGNRKIQAKRKNANTSNKQDHVLSTYVTSRTGQRLGIASYTTKTIKLSAVTASAVNMLMIGDSKTETLFNGPDGDANDGYGFSSYIQSFYEKDKKDGLVIANGFRTCGTRGYTAGRVVAYRGESLGIRSFHEGRGGWCAATFARHPILLTSGGGASVAGILNGAASWNFLGRAAIAGRQYNGSTADANVIRETLFLAATVVDYTAALWDALKLRAGWTGGEGAWADNPTNRGYIDAMITAIRANPDNKFYTSSGSGFTYGGYLTRWKTMDTNGARLVVGSGAGSLIDSGNLNTLDVVAGNSHILIELGENDRWQFPGDYAKTAADLILIGNRFVSDSTPIPKNKIAFIFPRWLGSYDTNPTETIQSREVPYSWLQYDSHALSHFRDIASALRADGWTVLDVDAVQDPACGAIFSNEKYYFDAAGNKQNMGGYDAIHPGKQAIRNMAFQCYAWILSTLAA